MDGGAAAIVATVFEMERERASQRAAAALEMFEIEARTAGISYQSRASGELPGDAAASIGTAALCGRSAAGHGTRHFRQYRSSGNPVSVRWTGLVRASYLSRGLQSQAHRCLLGRMPAGRPRIGDARPFLAQADALVAISINGAHNVPADASSEELARHLTRARCR